MKSIANSQTEIPEFLSLAEVARRLGVSEHTVSRWVKTRKMRAFRVVNITRISRQDFLDFIKSNTIDLEVAHDDL